MPDKLLCIGHGKMGGALVDRWSSLDASRRVTVVDFDPVTRALAASKGYEAIARCADLSPGQRFDIVLIAIKPQQLAGLGQQLAKASPVAGLYLSILAGMRLGRIRAEVGDQVPVIRTMPNLPGRIGMGVTACWTDRIDDLARAAAVAFFSSQGEVVWLDREADFDAVTAVSGSGPAYVFHLIECLEAAGVEQGLPPTVARQLAVQTVAGAGALAAQADTDPSQLRTDVTSKGGTTAAALDVLMEAGGLARLIAKAVRAATLRSRELGARH